jgi:hypothetical protein
VNGGLVAHPLGTGTRDAYYDVADTELPSGSTLGGPKCVLIIKATGAIETIYASDYGKSAIGTMLVHHWDAETGIALTAMPGHFRIHPEHQEHFFRLSNGIEVHEDIFVLSGAPAGDRVDPPAAYYHVELVNPTDRAIAMDSYLFAQLRGTTERNVASAFDVERNALVAWNVSDASFVRTIACSDPATSWETTMDHGKAVVTTSPGSLTNAVVSPATDPFGVLHHRRTLAPGERVHRTYIVSFSLTGDDDARALVATLPSAADALAATHAYYHAILSRSVVLTPDPFVNGGVLWAKANMLRTMLKAPTGWSFVNDPTRSNNSVARDTAWFGFGADYITPDFAEASLLWYAEHLEPNGMVVEYYDIRNGTTADYGLNINDNTPLLILALWHHYNATESRAFLERVYQPARRAAEYLLSQRDERGLVWCTSDKTSDWGIIGWRNVIADYMLSGAVTEVNAECYSALRTAAHMAHTLGIDADAAHFDAEAAALQSAINTHLFDPRTKLYYLNIETDGVPRSDVTSDLVFPVMFNVCDGDVAAGIISRLSVEEFWTDGGMRTVPRNSPHYGPIHGYGLLGGVWTGVAFWYAFAAARFNPEFVAFALSSGFRHYSRDPRGRNTVPGQFSEWLHGETLANQGMMLSPWLPPRYLWAAIEGMGGLDLSGRTPSIEPHLAADWKWMGVRDVLVGGRRLTWIAARVPELSLFTNVPFTSTLPTEQYSHDISDRIAIEGNAAVAIALRDDDRVLIFVGNTADRSITTYVRLDLGSDRAFAVREFNSFRGAWIDGGTLSCDELARGHALQIDSRGFIVLELQAHA